MTLIEKLRKDRETAVSLSDWGLVYEIDRYLERLGHPYRLDDRPETTEQRTQPEDTADRRPARNARR